MTKQRGVRFQHNRPSNGSDPRRPSSSNSSESLSEKGSPTRNGDIGLDVNGGKLKATTIKEEPSEYEKKKATFITRAIWSFAMMGGFFTAMFSGHVYVLMIIAAVQMISFKEVIAIAHVPVRVKNLPHTRSINWYFFVATMYFLYGESVIYYFKHILLVDKVLLPFATHHRFISFMLYTLGQSLRVTNSVTTDYHCRLRCIRGVFKKRLLPFPVHPICLDTYGLVRHSRASAIWHQQSFRGHDMVLVACFTCHYE